MTATGPRTINRRTYNASQSWHFEELLETADGTRLRVSIRSNAYDEQSRATVERWDGMQWQEVSRRAGVELVSRHGSHNDRRAVNYTSRTLSPAALAAFEADRADLLADAAAILGGGRRPISDLVDALDGYNRLDSVQRNLILSWNAGADVNDIESEKGKAR